MKTDSTDTVKKASAQPDNVRSSIVKISPEYKLEKVASRPDQGRPAIENVKLATSKRFGDCAVATNGRSLAVVPIIVKEGDNDQGLISIEALKASRKNKPLEGFFMLDGKIELPNSDTLPRPSVAETRYPNWEMVIPSYPITFEIGVNARLLHELCEAIGAKDEIVRLSFSDALSPVVVTRCGGRNNGEYGVLMPGRLS